MKTYMCLICGYVYDEAEGDVESGIPAGTRWDDVPLSWRCPECGDPVFVKSAKGAWLQTEDGRQMIDYVGS